MQPVKILFVDDDHDILDLVEKYLSRHHYHIRVVDNAMDALDRVIAGDFDIVFTDYKMPDVDGLELLSAIKSHKPETVVVIVTGHGTMESAIEAMRFGSYDYIQKPFKLEVLKMLIDRVYEEKKLAGEAVRIRKRAKPRHRYGALIGINLKMQEIYETIERMRNHSPDVMIHGEIGTGKALVAQVLHQTSDRAELRLIPVKCSGFAGGLSKKQTAEKIGELWTDAADGTLYFDEIEELPAAAQTAILSHVRDRKAEGGGVKSGVRIIAASRMDVHEFAGTEKMNGPLCKHLRAISIQLPPLRERKEDICLLIICFLDKLKQSGQTTIAGISPDAMDALLSYHWPGNIIQLENVLERAVAMGVKTLIRSEDLPSDLRAFGSIAENI